jgi:hypothetical protein
MAKNSCQYREQPGHIKRWDNELYLAWFSGRGAMEEEKRPLAPIDLWEPLETPVGLPEVPG